LPLDAIFLFWLLLQALLSSKYLYSNMCKREKHLGFSYYPEI
jgi:hypothetical protein